MWFIVIMKYNWVMWYCIQHIALWMGILVYSEAEAYARLCKHISYLKPGQGLHLLASEVCSAGHGCQCRFLLLLKKVLCGRRAVSQLRAGLQFRMVVFVSFETVCINTYLFSELPFWRQILTMLYSGRWKQFSVKWGNIGEI